MANEQLVVGIGSDISGLQKGISDAEKEIKKLEKQQKADIKLGLDTSTLQTQINTAKGKLSELQGAMTKTSATATAFKGKVADGGQSLMAFSRIAQDAPYGIIGVGNNITQLAEQFSYLSKNTGSTGGALKAMATSLMGTGGILLAVSLVTTAFTILSQSGMSLSDLIGKLTGDFDSLGNSIKKASEEGIKSTVSEISSIKALVSIAQDETKAKRERLAAVEELQKQYPAYFGNLTTEQMMTKDLTSETKELSKALINRAIAQKLTEAAIEPTLKLYQANARLKKQKLELIQAEKDLASAVADRSLNPAVVLAYSNAFEKAKMNVSDTRDEIVSLTNETDKLQKNINKLSGSASKLLITPEKTGKEPKVKTEPIKFKYTLVKDESFDISEAQARQDYINSMDRIDDDLIAAGIGAKITESLLPDAEVLDGRFIEIFNVVSAFQLKMGEMLSQAVDNGLFDLGSAIGDALISGASVIDSAGASLLGSLGSFISNMAKEMIAVGALGSAFGALMVAIKSNPALAIPLGITLAAVGAALSSKSKAIGQSASAGPAGGGNINSSGGTTASYSGSAGGYTGGGFSGNNVVFEISGQSLIGVLSNTTDANRRLGGALGI